MASISFPQNGLGHWRTFDRRLLGSQRKRLQDRTSASSAATVNQSLDEILERFKNDGNPPTIPRAQPSRVGFLSLSREIRQMILLETITDITEESFRKDQKFHKRLQDLPKAVLIKIFGYVTNTNLEYKKKRSRCTCTDCVQRTFVKHNGQQVYAPWLATTIIMDAYGLVPITVLGIAQRISAVHPIVIEDMGWILTRKLNEWALRVRGPARHGFVCPLDMFCAKWCVREEARTRTDGHSMRSTVYRLACASEPWDSQGSWRDWKKRGLGFSGRRCRVD